MFSLTGRTALITGASSGLGTHFAEVLANAGARVIVAARRKDRLDALVKKIQASGGEALAISMDVTNRDSILNGLADADQFFGIIDILVNNAGISIEGHCLDLNDRDLDLIMDVNIKAIWTLSTTIARQLRDKGTPGSIINVASILGLNTAPSLSLYAMTKAAVIQLTKSLALDLWPDNIRVNAICPGYFKTEMNEDFFSSTAGEKFIKRIPPKRLGHYEELSGPLLLLASDASSFMTGTALPVDGGHSVRII